MKKITRIILVFSTMFLLSNIVKASHGLPLINQTYTIGSTGITINASSDAATCGSGPFWMQSKVSCSPTAFANTAPEPCIKTFLQNWTGPGVTYNAFPWYNVLLNVPNYNVASGWYDDCLLEPYHTTFIPFTDLCPGKVYYFACREIVTGGFGSPGPFGPVVSFTVPGTPAPTVPGFVSSSPATSPSSPSCGGPVILTFTPPQGCGPVKALVPGCASCDSLVWFGPSGVIAVNTLTVSVSPLSTTTYTVKYDTCSAAAKVGCGAPYNPLITVYVANTNAMFVSPPTLCAGSTANFSATLPSLNDLWTVSPTTSVTPSSGTGPNFSAIFDDPGTFVITHQAINGSCTDVQSQTITITPGITSSISTSGGGCAGPSGSGSATVTVSSSTVGLTYLWAPTGNTSNVQSNIPFNTTYSVTMSNGGCVITKTVVISNNPAPSVTSFSVTPPLCNGQSNGTVAVNLVSGNAPFSFTWSPTITQTTQTVTGVAAGTYSVLIVDNNGCTTSSVVTVTEPTVLTLTASPGGTICSGASYSLTSGAAGGTPTYSYSWNPGNLTGSSIVVNPLATTQYTSTVSDANGCSTTQTLEVTVGPQLTAAAGSMSICASSGSVTLTPTLTSVGNGAPYTYSWSPGGATTSTISVPAAVTPGSVTFTLTVSDGCTVPSAVAVFTVVTTTAPSISSFSVTQPFCNGDATGTVSANLVGGSAPFIFTWSPTITQTTQTVTGVAAGAYSVNVMDIAGCTTSSVVTVSQPTALTLTTSASSTVCAGTAVLLNGSATGGTPGYNYVWNPGNTTTTLSVQNPTVSTVYTLEVMDAKGCIQTQTTSITVKPVLTATGLVSSMCMGDSVLLTPTITSPGNGGPYTYSWSNGATTPTTVVYGTTPTTTNYVLTISDGCTMPSATAIFTVSTNPPPTANIVADSLVGYAPLTVNFADLGIGGNTFNWNFGNGSTATTQVTSQIYQNGGTYQVTYSSTSLNGCVAYDTLSVLVIDLVPQIIVPNVFTPNGDKANDLFAVSGINVTQFECSIFNRWGKLVFSSSDIMKSWDGKINGNAADEGTYFYIIKAGGAVGEDIKQQGYVTLFR